MELYWTGIIRVYILRRRRIHVDTLPRDIVIKD